MAATILELKLLFIVLIGQTHLCLARPTTVMRQESFSSHSGKSRLSSSIERQLQGVPSSRLFAVEESVRPTFEAFPKNAMGQIPPRDIFPSIIRSYFAKEHGWQLKGLEPPHLKGYVSDVHNVLILQHHAPEFVASLQEVHESDHGISLSEVVGTIVAIEKLVLEESRALLGGAYALNKVSADDQITPDHLHEVLRSYLLLYRHGTPHNLTDVAGHHEMKLRAQKAEDWQKLVEFEKDVLDAFRPHSISYSFETVEQLTQDLTLKFGKWQNSECDDMKTTLMGIASKRGSGEVLFKDFHAEPAHASFQFTEDEEYLRKTGTLDESDPKRPSVLIANYLRGPSNCIASSEYYSVCCLSECDSLLSDLEQRIQAPIWPADRIVAVVRDMLPASADLPETLVNELHSIAKRHEDAVPLHSADFRRWLHDVHPNECPRQTRSEDVAEDSEWKQAEEWLDIQSKCTRIPEWHPIMHEDSIEV